MPKKIIHSNVPLNVNVENYNLGSIFLVTKERDRLDESCYENLTRQV